MRKKVIRVPTTFTDDLVQFVRSVTTPQSLTRQLPLHRGAFGLEVAVPWFVVPRRQKNKQSSPKNKAPPTGEALGDGR